MKRVDASTDEDIFPVFGYQVLVSRLGYVRAVSQMSQNMDLKVWESSGGADSPTTSSNAFCCVRNMTAAGRTMLSL